MCGRKAFGGERPAGGSEFQLTRRAADRHSGGVLTAAVRVRCLEAVPASAPARHGGDDVARRTAGVRS